MRQQLLYFLFFVTAFCITKQPTPEPSSPPTRQPSPAPTLKPVYCNGTTVVSGVNGTINYVAGNYASKTCSWALSAQQGEVLFLNFSRLEISVDPGYCANCAGACLRSSNGASYTCNDLASFCNSSDVVPQVCPRSCKLCDTCQYNYLRGRSGGAEVIRACGPDTPMPFLVTTPFRNLTLDVVWGQLVSLGHTPIAASDGFTLSWKSIPPPVPFNGTPACSGVKDILGPSEGLISDGSEGFYAINSDCVWVLRAPAGNYVSLQFLMFQLKPGTSMGANGFTSCLSDFVRVYDGNLTAGTASSLGTFCGDRIPRNITSSQDTLSVQFISDNTKSSAVGFEARYFFTPEPGPSLQYCDGQVRMTSPGTIIQSGDYGPSDCRWTVTAPPGQYVQLEFVELSIEPTFPTCEFDFIEVLDSNLLLMRLCDNVNPPIITSFSNEVEIVFFADDYLAGTGFTIVVNFVSSPGVRPYECTPGTLIKAELGETGILENGPVYGRSDDINANCSWTIVSPRRTSIKLIYRRFELDPGCVADAVSVYDGPNSSSPLLLQACGTQLPGTVTSTSNNMVVVYGANGRVTGSGFSARYTVVRESDDLLSTRQCDGLRDYNETGPRNISDRSDGSSPRVYCVWRITVPAGKFISLTVTSMNMGSGDDQCVFQYLAVHDGSTAQAFPLIDTCGRTLPATVRSSSNVLSIEYFNERSTNSPGFEATWEISDAGSAETRVCGGTTYPNVLYLPLNGSGATSGTISQAGSLVDYKHGVYCGWTIQAPPGQFVRLRYSSFASPGPNAAGVCSNSLAVLDGPTAKDYELQRTCGNTLPLTVTSTQPFMSLQLLTFGPAPFLFEAQWDFVSSTPGRTCNGTVELRESSGSISDGDQGYANNAKCVFRIEAPVGQVIQLTVVSFALQGPVAGSCRDVVRIESDSNVLFEGCSLVANTKFVSPSRSVVVTFTSDKSIVSDGFLINYLFIVPPPPSPPPTPLPTTPEPTAPTARELTFEPTTGSPVQGMMTPSNKPTPAPQEEKQDVVGVVIGTLVVVILVGTIGGIVIRTLWRRKREAASAVEGLDMRTAAQDLDDGKAPKKRGGNMAQVQPIDDDDEEGKSGGREITVL